MVIAPTSIKNGVAAIPVTRFSSGWGNGFCKSRIGVDEKGGFHESLWRLWMARGDKNSSRENYVAKDYFELLSLVVGIA